MLKRTTEEVAAYFAEQGCELLDEYRGAMKKMRYRCKCGNISSMNWSHFSRGKRCGACAKYGMSKKRSLEEVRLIFSERGCVFLDDVFNGIHFKHRYRCKCGREDTKCFASFHHQQQYCKQCGLEKNRGSGHHDWIPDREQKRLNDLFRKKCYKALQSTLEHTKQRKHNRTHELLGYTHKQLQEYIKKHQKYKLIENGSWHLDHIFPISAFIEYGITDIGIINALDNLQPLPGKENISKGDTYDEEAFLAWLKTKNILDYPIFKPGKTTLPLAPKSALSSPVHPASHR